MPVRKSYLLDTVLKIVTQDQWQTPFRNGRPSDGWYNAFMTRHPELSLRNAESISRQRGQLTEQCIRGWFKDTEEYFRSKNIENVLGDAERNYNADETGFLLNPKTGKVLGPTGQGMYSEAGGCKTQVSVLVTTRADGKLMQPVIYPYKRAVPKEIVDRVPHGYGIARSDSGWMTSDIFFEYVANVFVPELEVWRRQKKGLREEEEELVLDDQDWVVLWIDGYKSHLTVHASLVCDQNKIVLYCFKAHSSHITQPNDVGPFKPLKHEWMQAVSEWRSQPDHYYDTLTRAEFAEVLQLALNKLKADCIVSGYRATGLVPWNPNAVHYEKITDAARRSFKNIQFRDFTSPDNRSSEEIALAEIEKVLGAARVDVFNRLSRGEKVNTSSFQTLSAYDLWLSFKVKTSTSRNEGNGADITDDLEADSFVVSREEVTGGTSTLTEVDFVAMMDSDIVTEFTIGTQQACGS